MNVEIKNTNTTEATATLVHEDIVSLLGLAVKMKAGIASDQLGTTVTVKLVPVEGSDEFTAEVDVLVDHNAKPETVQPPVVNAPVPVIVPSIVIPAGLGGIPTA